MTAAVASVEAIECERKYSIDARAELPELDRIDGVEGTSVDHQVLTATYYDAGDLRLLRAGITLRRRVGGSDEGWHLKLPIDGDSRTELRLPLSAGSTPPDRLTNVVSARLRAASLGPVATITTDRESHRLLSFDDAVLAEVVLDQVHGCAATVGATPVEWREVEVEWDPHAKSLLVELERRLAAAGAVRANHPNKLSRVLVAPVDEPAAKPRDSSEAWSAYLDAQCEAIVGADLGFRRGGAEAVHEIRVAMRRARSALGVIDDVVGNESHAQLIDELRWLGGELAVTRDVEVQRDRLTDLLSTIDRELIADSVPGRIAAYFADRERVERGRAVDALNSPRYFHLLDALFDAASSFAGRPADASGDVTAALARIRHRVHKRVANVSRTSDQRERETAAHRARKGVKLMRYAFEVTRPLAEHSADVAIAGLGELQGILGEHQDSVVARKELLALRRAAEVAGEDAFVYGVMYQREDDIAADLLARLPHAWKHAENVCRKVKIHH
ncbi:MAG: CYTH and CHAD domain-containing protein [Nocardiaceae bacterium]|nr:CYTH and CHAD domain-containing protein [Nocardiaceae bacterium]